MMSQTGNRIVASLVPFLSSHLHQAQADVLQRLGYQHQFFLYNEPIPESAEIIFLQGPYDSLLPFARQFVALPPERRPLLVYWFQQSLNMLNPEWLRLSLGQLFSDLARDFQQGKNLFSFLQQGVHSLFGTTGKRYGYLADILWLHRSGLLDVLALSSTVYAEYLSQYGIGSLLVPRGYHPGYGQILNYERDIAVVWMGKTRTGRRRRAVYWLQKQLQQRGLTMHIYDGVANDFIYKNRRTEILNRARFVLNVLPDPTWELSVRYFIAAANGAVLLTEPGENKYPFVPGKHIVECPIEMMPDTITYYLEHEDARRAISESMLHLCQTELTLKKSVARIMEAAEHALKMKSERVVELA